MSTPVPIDSIQGEKLTHEQSAYLDGFFSGLRERGVSFGNVAPNPVTASAPMPGDLIFEERVKREMHPLDAYPVLIDHARARVAEKRGGVQQRVALSSVEEWQPAPQSEDVLILDEALSKLEQADGRAAKVVELRFFGGLREQEVADVLGVSVITVKRDWKVARAWLVDQLQSR